MGCYEIHNRMKHGPSDVAIMPMGLRNGPSMPGVSLLAERHSPLKQKRTPLAIQNAIL